MISMATVKRGAAPKPPVLLVYSGHGLGKTTLGASAPSPIFLQTEDGLGSLDVPTFGLLRTFDEMMQAIGALYAEEHEFQTVVLDSMDHLEPLIWAQTCKDNGWANLESPGYGKGFAAALDHWRILMDGFKALRDDKGMTVLMLAHCMVQRFDAPDSEPYDRYQPKLHKGASALVQELADGVFFGNYRISTVKSDQGFGKTVTRAVGGGDRVLYTEERPAFLAKRRFETMPSVIPLSWDAIAQHIPALAHPASAASAA
ncbi:MAG: hypothetical protein NVS1B6_15800 [Steroidobacteraceae bacterium]